MIYISTNKKHIHKLLKYVMPVLLLFVIVIMTSLVLTSIYKSAYKVTINDNVIGYVKDREEFDKAYDTLKNERIIEQYESKVYLENNPEFTKCYVKDDIVKDINIYTNLREYIKTEYKIYNIYVKDIKEMTFNNKEEAQKYLSEIKTGVETEIAAEVKEEIINDPIDTITSDRAEAIATELVSRYKPVREVKVETKKQTNVVAKKPATNVTPNPSAMGGVWPSSYKMISCYFGEDGHKGIDLANNKGTPICAYKAGTVTFAGWSGRYGKLIIIDNGNGVQTKYAHSSEIYVSAGQHVEEGEVISAMGSTGQSTGNHLHFEILVNGSYQNPLTYLK